MGNEDRESSAASSNDERGSSDKRCAYCGTPIDTGDWYPVTKERDGDGSLEFYSFCSEECQDDWRDEREQ